MSRHKRIMFQSDSDVQAGQKGETVRIQLRRAGDEETVEEEESEVKAAKSKEFQQSSAEKVRKPKPRVSDTDFCLVGFADSLTNRQTKGIRVILEELLDQLFILESVCGAAGTTVDLSYKSVDERFDTNAADETIYDPVTIELMDAAYAAQADYNKFQKDRTWLETVIQEVMNFEDLGHKLLIFKQILTDHYHTEDDNDTLLEELNQNIAELEDIKRCLVEEKVNSTHELRVRLEKIGALKDEIEDLMAYNKIKRQYMESWEDNRMDTNRKIHTKKTREYKALIRKYHHEMQKEDRIHNEIVKYILISQDMLNTDIEKWMEKYVEDTEALDMKIDSLRIENDSQAEKHLEVKAEYEKRSKEIKEYLAYKEVKRQEAQELKRRHIAATKIQAWWRGTMFRKGLGPYRKKKGKRGKSDKKKGTASPKGKKKN